MGYFPVRYNSRVVNYEHRGFIRLETEEGSIAMTSCTALAANTECLKILLYFP